MKPTIGRIVHYTTADLTVLAAIISAVHDGVVDLHVFEVPGGIESLTGAPAVTVRYLVPFTEAEPGTEKAKSCWAWPPRVT